MADDLKNIKKILVIKLRHIGDTLMTVPVFRALREKFPDVHISALLNKGTEETLSGHPAINEVIVFDNAIKKLSFAKRYHEEISFLKMVRSKNFDLTIDLTGGDRAAIISFVSGARLRSGIKADKGFPFKKNIYTNLIEVDNMKHIVLQNLKPVKELGIEVKNFSIDFTFDGNDRMFIRNFLTKSIPDTNSKVVHIHPTSRWLFKCWKDEYTAEIINWLLEQKATVIMTSSPDKKEIDKAKKIMSMVNRSKSFIDLCGKITLKQLGIISEFSDIFFGVDSAPMHIAAAVGTPVIALFGPSGAFNWGPWDNGISNESNPYPERNGIQTFGMHTVIQKDWTCIPCGIDGCEGSKISKCLYEISPALVKELLLKKLGKTRA